MSSAALSHIATAGAYMVEGVGASFLFGQTLAELLTCQDNDQTRMPWVTRRSLEEIKRWEPEPFPRLGPKATMIAFGAEEWAGSIRRELIHQSRGLALWSAGPALRSA